MKSNIERARYRRPIDVLKRQRTRVARNIFGAAKSSASFSFPELSASFAQGIRVSETDKLDLSKIAVQGISASLFLKSVADSALSLREWSDILDMSERTIHRYDRERLAFDPIRSDKILQLLMLDKRGLEVFGEKDRFVGWMHGKTPALGGLRPTQLLESAFGVSLLMDVLGRIEYGVYS